MRHPPRRPSPVPAVWIAAALVALLASPARAGDDRVVVHVYGGWGTPARVEVSGRVLSGEPGDVSGKGKGALENLIDNISALESDELAQARVAVRLGAHRRAALTDDEGLFRVVFEALDPPLAAGGHDVEVAAEDPAGLLAAGIGTGRAFVLGPETRALIVSDIDDTVVQTEVTRKLMLLANTFLKNAESATPVPGKGPLYRLVAAGATGDQRNPVFYVSGSPINLFPRLEYYLRLHGFPAGPILLKNLGLASNADPLFAQEGYKAGKIRPILDAFPGLPVLCFGDDGEKDPEIYAALARDLPGRVKHISIRIVTAGTKPDSPRFAGMTASRDAFGEARGLVRAGLLTEAQALEVARAALGERPLPEGFSLDSDLPALPAGDASEWTLDKSDVWDNFFRFLSQNWLPWARLVGAILGWCLLGLGIGGVLGFGGGALLFWRLRARGWTRNRFSWYGWVGWAVAVWFVLVCAGGGAWCGAYLGGGYRVRQAILGERVVQKTLIQLAITMLATAEQHVKVGDLAAQADEISARGQTVEIELDQKLAGTVDRKIGEFMAEREGAGALERGLVKVLGQATLRALREKPELKALRGAVLLTDEELTRALDEDPAKAVTTGFAALRPLLLKLDDALAGQVSGLVWSGALLVLLGTAAFALAPIGLVRLLDRWLNGPAGVAGAAPSPSTGPGAAAGG